MVRLEEPFPLSFFFHLVSDDELIRDGGGIRLSVDDGVSLCAARALQELRQEGFFAAGIWQGWQIEITDETGRTVLEILLSRADAAPFALAVHQPIRREQPRSG